MRKIKFIALILALNTVLCSCAPQEKETSETVLETIKITETTAEETAVAELYASPGVISE